MTDDPKRPQCGCCQPDPDLSTINDWIPESMNIEGLKAKAREIIREGRVAFDTPIAIPNADAVAEEGVNYLQSRYAPLCDAERYELACKEWHYRPDVRNLQTFKLFNVDWFSTQYNEQGFLEVDLIVFKDRSDYSKNGGIDKTHVGS